METNLTNKPVNYYANLFWQRAVKNVNYWRDYVIAYHKESTDLRLEREQIINALDYALDLPTAWPAALSLIENFSPYMERWGYWNQWQETLEQAVTVAHRLEDKTSEIKLEVLLARLSQRQGHFEGTIANYRQAIHQADRIGDVENKARACSNLGFLYAELGYWWRAEILCCHALAVFEELNHKHGCAHTENHLGVLYELQRRWDEAQHHLERACKLWQSMGDDHGLMYGYLNLSAIYIAMGQPDQALPYLEKALIQAKLVGEEILIGTIYMNIGQTHYQNKEFEQAESYARQAETIFRRFSNAQELARVWDNLGMVCFNQGKREEAKFYLEASLDIWRKLNNDHGEINVLIDIVEYELTTGNSIQARIRLNELERLLSRYNHNNAYAYLQPTLTKYRRSLVQ